MVYSSSCSMDETLAVSPPMCHPHSVARRAVVLKHFLLLRHSCVYNLSTYYQEIPQKSRQILTLNRGVAAVANKMIRWHTRCVDTHVWYHVPTTRKNLKKLHIPTTISTCSHIITSAKVLMMLPLQSGYMARNKYDI